MALQTLPLTDISYLDIPSANITTAYLALKDISPNLPKLQIKTNMFAPDKIRRDQEYLEWIKMQNYLFSISDKSPKT